NVVWEVDAGTSYEIFIRKFIESSVKERKDIIYISFNKSVPTLLKEFSNFINEKFHIIDGFTSGKGKNDATFLRNYEEIINKVSITKLSNPSNLDELIEAIAIVENKLKSYPVYIFDSLTGIQNVVKDEDQTYSFFTYMCPRLFDLESIAYWILEKDAHSQKFKANIRHITQVVLELYRRKDSFFIKALKLSRRKHREAFKPHMYEITSNEEIEIKSTEPSLNLDLGSKLKKIRILKNMSQKELAEKVNLTAGFISQMENNQIVPSLTSFLQICEALGIKPSEILDEKEKEEDFIIRKEEIKSKVSYKISNAEIFNLLSDSNFKVFFIVVPPNESVKGHFFVRKSPELIFVTKGELSVSFKGAFHTLREGDILYIKNSIPEEWINKGGDIAEILVVSLM
ncbi:MAG: helix-turn-helix domain-containing protein, partial [Thermodesulfovibrio sp.]|nr:helix-turn-helix domain-containing protein [Thermodesulfovibrio sp.]